MKRTSVRAWVACAAVLALGSVVAAPRPPAPSPTPSPRRAVTVADDRPASDAPVVGLAAAPDGGGYWLAASDGGVFAFGDAPYEGSMGGQPLAAPVVGIASTGDGRGYWLAGSDGGVFAFGDAAYHGSMGATPLARPVVGVAADPATGGYWLVASDGGVFAFDAPFEGSMGGRSLAAPVVGMAPTPDGAGYWLVASDGGVFAFGDAAYHGSMGATPLARPAAAVVADPATGGYWLVGSDGGVFAFDAPFEGSMGRVTLDRAVVGGAGTPSGAGYWLAGADGGLFAFGDASYEGSVDVPPLAGLTVVLDPGHDGGNGGDPAYIDRPIDGGGFTEPCDTAGTSTADGYTEHAFNFSVAASAQALLQAAGATVVLTRPNDDGVGPCVNVRAAIANDLHAAAAVSIHADGGPPGGFGFAVDEPAGVVSPISDNLAIVGPSAQLGADVRDAFETATGEPPSDYTGQDGIVVRSDLGGLNLSTVPKVLIECANMQNAHDAALTENPQWRQLAAQGIAAGVEDYLEATERT